MPAAHDKYLSRIFANLHLYIYMQFIALFQSPHTTFRLTCYIMPISDYHKLETPLDFPKDFLAYNINPEKCTLKILQLSIKNACVAFTSDESVNRDSMAYNPFVQKFRTCIRKIQSTRDKDAAKWFFYILRRQFIVLAEFLYGNARVEAENVSLHRSVKTLPRICG